MITTTQVETGLGTVLVVDDDPSIGRLLSMILATENIHVDRAESGPDAIAHLCDSHEQPDLIILDLSMPGMDGREVFQAVRRSGVTAPIVFCSAYGADAAKRDMGAEGAINKPFNPETLIQVVRSFVPNEN